jgi:hypothetical protein
MTRQTYQEVSRIIKKDLQNLRKKGYNTLGEIDSQKYFYDLKNENPEKYERLTFDTNGAEPFSEDLERILGDFRVCGYLKTIVDVLPR